MKIRLLMLAVVALLGLLLAGCSEDKGQADGTSEGEARGRIEGQRAGTDQGYNDGAAAGSAQAREEADRGAYWEIYLRPSLLALAAGLLIGLALQAGLLMRLQTHSVSEPVAALFVPGLCQSEAYRRWNSVRSLAAAAQQRLGALELDHRAQIRALEQLQSLMEKHIASAQRIGDLSRSKLLELFDREAQEIIEEARQKVNSIRRKE